MALSEILGIIRDLIVNISYVDCAICQALQIAGEVLFHGILLSRLGLGSVVQLIVQDFRAGIGLLSGEHLAKGKLPFVFQVDKALDAESHHDRCQKKRDGQVHDQCDQKRTDQL